MQQYTRTAGERKHDIEGFSLQGKEYDENEFYYFRVAREEKSRLALDEEGNVRADYGMGDVGPSPVRN